MKFSLLLLTLLLVGCSASNTPSSADIPQPVSAVAMPTIQNSNSASPILSNRTPNPATHTPSTKPDTIAISTPTATCSLLEITLPADASIVNTAKIQIVGQTSPNAVVSVNGDLVDLDTVGKFQYAITLDQGANIIEIVASDPNGNEQDKILRVIYEP